jgi:hypothetical protein
LPLKGRLKNAKEHKGRTMITKLLIIAGISIGLVLALFVMGRILDKKPWEDVTDMPRPDEK